MKRLHAAAGWSLGLMIVLALVHGLWPRFPAWPAGLAGWFAGVVLWKRVVRAQQALVGALLGVGLAGMAWGWRYAGTFDWESALARNHALLAMIAAVSFLRLISMPRAQEADALPAGRNAFLRTLVSTHLFSAVINISTVMIVGDRLSRGSSLDKASAVLLSRGFSSAALWSPFFAAMATTLTYAPRARLPVLMAVGLPLAAAALLCTYRGVLRSQPDGLAGFQGYPLRAESLRVPALLGAGVFAMHALVPSLSILTVITLLSPSLAALVLARRDPFQGIRTVAAHVRERLPEMCGELALFLAAGVLASGLAAVMATLGSWTPFHGFGGTSAALTLAAMVVLAVLGVHPVISISTVAVLAAPSRPDPNLLAMVFLMAWSIGAATSPLSGLHLILQGRYGIPGRRLFRWNLGYSTTLVMLCALVLNLYHWLA
jgi:hypothetical protein